MVGVYRCTIHISDCNIDISTGGRRAIIVPDITFEQIRISCNNHIRRIHPYNQGSNLESGNSPTGFVIITGCHLHAVITGFGIVRKHEVYREIALTV